MKRARTSGGSVTGGTGDVKPQIFTIATGTAGAVDDYVVNNVSLPVPRIGMGLKRATIFEILKVFFYPGIVDIADTTQTKFVYLTTATTRADGDTSTLATLNTDLNDPRVFACAVFNHNVLTSGGISMHFPITIDLSDDNGNGYLVATDRLSIVGGDIGGTTASGSTAKVLYRLVNVGIEEYVGIVQSQQGLIGV